MPYNDPDYKKKYNEKNRQEINRKSREYYDKNKELIKGNYNPDKRRQYNIDNSHIKKPAGWKARGMKLKEGEDWFSVYLFYITCENCEECDVILTDEKNNTPTRRNLDHDHSTGFIRNVLCFSCNTKRR